MAGRQAVGLWWLKKSVGCGDIRDGRRKPVGMIEDEEDDIRTGRK
jgi:hypothetical protein